MVPSSKHWRMLQASTLPVKLQDLQAANIVAASLAKTKHIRSIRSRRTKVKTAKAQVESTENTTAFLPLMIAATKRSSELISIHNWLKAGKLPGLPVAYCLNIQTCAPIYARYSVMLPCNFIGAFFLRCLVTPSHCCSFLVALIWEWDWQLIRSQTKACSSCWLTCLTICCLKGLDR